MRGKQHPVLAVTSKPGGKELLHAINSTPPDEAWECPYCLQPLPFQNLEWRDALEPLLAKYTESMEISPNLAGFSIVEQWWHYRALKRFEAGQ